MTFNIMNQIDSINVAELNDMTQVQAGGSGRGLLPTGTAIVRMCMYVEFGSHVQEFQGQKKPPAPIFKLGFRIVGGGGLNLEGKGEKYVVEEGQFPLITTFDTTMSLFEKSKAVKYFTALNRVGNKATHFVQKIQEQCLYALPISTKKNKQGKDVQVIDFSNLQPAINPTTYNAYTDADMPKLSEEHIQVFLWSHPTPEMWKTIHKEGQWEAQKDDSGKVTRPARSKNWLQEKCFTAVDFEGSPLQLMLQEQGADYTIPELGTEPDVQEEAVQETPVAPEVEGAVLTPPTLD